MAQQTADGGGSTGNLQIESLRLTAFLAPSARPGEPTWWAELTGSQPESRTSKPARAELQETGTFEDRSLTLSVQPGRVDWFLTPHPSQFEAGSATEVKSVGRFPKTLDLFVPLMLRWLNMCPPTIRLAFGAVLLEPVQDKQAGYRRLSDYLPSIRIDSKGSEDFFYQINRPRKSALAINDFRINRLSKWSVSSFQFVRMAVGPQFTQSYQGEKVLACRIELDVSTPADFLGELPHERLAEIFRELVDLGSEIALHGDIA